MSGKPRVRAAAPGNAGLFFEVSRDVSCNVLLLFSGTATLGTTGRARRRVWRAPLGLIRIQSGVPLRARRALQEAGPTLTFYSGVPR